MFIRNWNPFLADEINGEDNDSDEENEELNLEPIAEDPTMAGNFEAEENVQYAQIGKYQY